MAEVGADKSRSSLGQVAPRLKDRLIGVPKATEMIKKGLEQLGASSFAWHSGPFEPWYTGRRVVVQESFST